MSAHKLYVGNLPYGFTRQDLQELFQGFGTVRSAEVILDRETGRSRGFGFVEMESAEALQQAIAGMHERNVQGRNLTVNEARERGPRAPGYPPRPSPPRSFPPAAPSGATGAGDGPRGKGDHGGRPEKGGPRDRHGAREERESGRGRRSGKWSDGDDDAE